MTWDVVLDAGAILAGLAALLAAFWSRQAKKKATLAANQTNGVLQDPLNLLLAGQRSLGHQMGEVRSDMGRMDARLSNEVAELRRSLYGPS